MPEVAWIWDNLYSAQLSCAVCSILRQVRQSAIRICLHDNTLTWPIAVLVVRSAVVVCFVQVSVSWCTKGLALMGKQLPQT